MSATIQDLLAQAVSVSATLTQAIEAATASLLAQQGQPTTFDGRPVIPMRATPEWVASWLPVQEPVTCGVATATGEPCARITEGGACWQHTPEAIAKREALAPVREAKQAAREAKREQAQARHTQWLADRGIRHSSEGGLVLLVKANGTVAQRSRNDLRVLGISVRKATPASEVEAMLRAAGLRFVSKPALG